MRKIKIIKKDQITETEAPAPKIEMTKQRAERALFATVSRWVSEKQRELSGIREEATQS